TSGARKSGTREQAVQRAYEVATHGAADAAVVHFEQLFVGVHDQFVVDADLAELVHDDGVAPAVVFGQDAVQQGGLARAQIAGQYGDRKAIVRRGRRVLSAGSVLHGVAYIQGMRETCTTSLAPSPPTDLM